MFKKTLVALAMAGVSVGANAATSTLSAGGSGTGSVLNAQVVSAEGAQSNLTLDFKTPAVTITHDIQNDTNYATAAKIRVTLTGATFNASTLLTARLNGKDLVNESEASYPASNVLEFDLTKDQDGATTGIVAGNDFVLGGLVFTPTSKVAGSNVTMKVETLSSIADAVIDTSTSVIAAYTSTVSSKITALTNTVDVTTDRKKFTGADLDDTFVITTTNKASDISFANASGKKQEYTVTGDFSWLDADGNGKVDSGVSIKAGATPVKFANDMQSFTFTSGSTSNLTGKNLLTDVETFTIATDGNRVIPTTGYSVAHKLAYVDDATTVREFSNSGLKTGDWKLNGTSVNVPYLPVGYDTLSANLEISNTSGINGDITIDAVDNNGVAHKAVKLTKVATKGAVTKVSEADIVAAFGLTTGTKLSLNVTVAAPTGISVYPYYRENDVRVSLPTSQYRARDCVTTKGTFAVTGAAVSTAETASNVGGTAGDNAWGDTTGGAVATTGELSTSCTVAN